MKPQNPWWSLLFNIVLPIVILRQGHRFGAWGPTVAVIVAISLPLIYGTIDFFKQKKINWISLIGLLNVGLTGGFALLKLQGHWFWIKEATFPLIIGIAILIANRLGRPFLWSLFWNPHIFQTDRIERTARGSIEDLKSLFARATDFFSLSFFISACANFLLATRIYRPIDPHLSTSAQASLLNAQIAHMTWAGYLMVALPMMLFSGGVFWYLIKSLERLTGLKFDEILTAH